MIHGWIALVLGSKSVKEAKPQVPPFSRYGRPKLVQTAFLDVFWGFRTVTPPHFAQTMAVRIFLRALIHVYQFPKNLTGRNPTFGDIEAQTRSKNAKNAQIRQNSPFLPNLGEYFFSKS